MPMAITDSRHKGRTTAARPVVTAGDGLPYVRSEDGTHGSEVGGSDLRELATVEPVLSARTAPAPSLGEAHGRGEEGGDIGLAMRLGLLPTVSSEADGGEVVDGLEPVYVNGRNVPYWQSHVRWFRWFATGDAALLLMLLAVGAVA